MIYDNCPVFLTGYLRYLAMVKNQPRSTVNGVYLNLKGFLQFQHNRKMSPPLPDEAIRSVDISNMAVWEVAELGEEDVEDYIDYLDTVAKNSQVTIRHKLVHLRSFWSYLIRNQEELGISISQNPAANIRADNITPTRARTLSATEIQRVLRAMDGETALRDRAMMLVILSTGVQLNQLIRIHCEDVEEDKIKIGSRYVYISEQCQEAIEDYLREFRDPISDGMKDKALFVSRQLRRRLTPRGVQKSLEKHFAAAGINATATDLRFTAAKRLLEQASSRYERTVIAEYLGYKSLKSLEQFQLPPLDKDSTCISSLLQRVWTDTEREDM